MFECILAAVWFLLGLLGVQQKKKSMNEDFDTTASPKLNKTPNGEKATPTSIIREIYKSAPNENERIGVVEKLIADLRSDIQRYRLENKRLAEENHQLRSRTGGLDKDQGKPSD